MGMVALGLCEMFVVQSSVTHLTRSGEGRKMNDVMELTRTESPPTADVDGENDHTLHSALVQSMHARIATSSVPRAGEEGTCETSHIKSASAVFWQCEFVRWDQE